MIKETFTGLDEKFQRRYRIHRVGESLGAVHEVSVRVIFGLPRHILAHRASSNLARYDGIRWCPELNMDLVDSIRSRLKVWCRSERRILMGTYTLSGVLDV